VLVGCFTKKYWHCS